MLNPTLERHRAVDLRTHHRPRSLRTDSDEAHEADHGPRADDILQALSNATSRDVLATCMASACSVREISRETATPLATTYRHVNELQDHGLLYLERSAISGEGKRFDLYRAALEEVAVEIRDGIVTVRWTLRPAAEERLRSMWRELQL